MKIKRFVAEDMARACELIKADLGPDALILSAQRLRPSTLSLRRRPQIEVVAGVAEPGDPPAGDGARRMPIEESALVQRSLLDAVEEAASASISPAGAARARIEAGMGPAPLPGPGPAPRGAPPPREPAGGGRGERETLLRLERHLLELREAVDRLNRPRTPLLVNGSGALRALHQRLEEQEIPDGLRNTLLTELRQALPADHLDDEAAVLTAAVEQLAGRIPPARPLRPAPGRTVVSFFVGPTGSGKTTSMVKLAAQLSGEGHAVLLVTTDVGRAGAVAQLTAYATALGLPAETVYSPGDLRTLVAGAAGYSVILVDTAGCSPENASRIAGLRSMLGTVRRKEVYLVLNGTAKLSDLRRACEQFDLAPISGIGLTRLDETGVLGPVLALLTELKAPLAFVGNGQDILADIRRPDIRELADAALGNERHDEMDSRGEGEQTLLAMGA